MSDYEGKWRYDVMSDGTIFRGKPYQLSEYDHWHDGETATCYVGFYTGNYRDKAHILSDSRWYEYAEDSERLLAAHKAALDYPQPGDRVGSEQSAITRWWGSDPVTRAARRVGLSGVVHVQPWPGDEYVIGYWSRDDATDEQRAEDARNTANAVEAYMTGDVWRIEVEEYNRHTDQWEHADDVCEEWNCDEFDEAYLKESPLYEFPAELLIEDRAS
jgi:hypothetical protein